MQSRPSECLLPPWNFIKSIAMSADSTSPTNSCNISSHSFRSSTTILQFCPPSSKNDGNFWTALSVFETASTSHPVVGISGMLTCLILPAWPGWRPVGRRECTLVKAGNLWVLVLPFLFLPCHLPHFIPPLYDRMLPVLGPHRCLSFLTARVTVSLASAANHPRMLTRSTNKDSLVCALHHSIIHTISTHFNPQDQFLHAQHSRDGFVGVQCTSVNTGFERVDL